MYETDEQLRHRIHLLMANSGTVARFKGELLGYVNSEDVLVSMLDLGQLSVVVSVRDISMEEAFEELQRLIEIKRPNACQVILTVKEDFGHCSWNLAGAGETFAGDGGDDE